MQNEVSMAKLRLAVHPDTQFMFALCCKLNTVITDSVPTAATNGIDLLINPEFFMSLTKDEQVFLLAHETLHVAYLHVLRRDDRNPVKFNCACDYVINSYLVERGFKMIEGGLYDKQYDGLSSEEVYDLLEELPNNPMAGDIILSEEAVEQITQNIISAVHSAEQSFATKSIPTEVKRYMEKLHKPKINWKVVLKRFLLEVDKSDYSWRRPNRRQLYSGRYMPSLYDNSVSRVTFAIDVSASITEDMFSQFISEVRNVFRQMKPKQIEIIQFHHNIANVTLVRSLDDFNKINFSETGGTNMHPVMGYMKNSQSKALVIITDGEFATDYPNIKTPTLWCVFNNEQFTPNFGKTIYFDLET